MKQCFWTELSHCFWPLIWLIPFFSQHYFIIPITGIISVLQPLFVMKPDWCCSCFCFILFDIFLLPGRLSWLIAYHYSLTSLSMGIFLQICCLRFFETLKYFTRAFSLLLLTTIIIAFKTTLSGYVRCQCIACFANSSTKYTFKISKP